MIYFDNKIVKTHLILKRLLFTRQMAIFHKGIRLGQNKSLARPAEVDSDTKSPDISAKEMKTQKSHSNAR